MTRTATDAAAPTTGAEHVVLLGPDHRPVGTAPKAEVHSTRTPLHLAFSCYLFDAAGRFLLTRRAVTKATWPGVWTNTACGHPAPGEGFAEAAGRRLRDELGLVVDRLDVVLPDFAYRAVDASGVVENEVCPVLVARVDAEAPTPVPEPSEVAEWRWVDWADVVETARRAPWALSPWAVLQVGELAGVDGLELPPPR